jgi:hypothetical protein
MMRNRLSIVAATFSVLLLAACAPGAGPADPTSTASETPSASPTPSPTPEPAALVLEPERLVVVDGAGDEMLVWKWTDEPGAIVDDLTELLGTAPVTTEQAADCCHVAAFDIYTWGGFALWIADLGGAPRDSYYLASFIEVTAAQTNGIPIRTRSNVEVGSTVTDALAAADLYSSQSFDGVGYYWVEPVDPSVPLDSSEINLTVLLISGADGATVASMTAPASPQFP